MVDTPASPKDEVEAAATWADFSGKTFISILADFKSGALSDYYGSRHLPLVADCGFFLPIAIFITFLRPSDRDDEQSRATFAGD
jgi:hypothetical protein